MNRTKINQKANIELKKLCKKYDLFTCEVPLNGCNGTYGLTFAHRHKRRWYYGKEHLLTDYKQFILCCLACHIKLEQDARLTSEIFQQLRGDE